MTSSDVYSLSLHIVLGTDIVLLSGVCRRLSSSVTLHGGL